MSNLDSRQSGFKRSTSLTLFEVALFAVVIDATLEIAEALKPEAQAKPTSCITASLALQASIVGLSANVSSKSATSKLTLRVGGGGAFGS